MSNRKGYVDDARKQQQGNLVASNFPAPGKAEAVLTESDMQRMLDLGLGRGVDATDPRPWLNKSSFQVRPVSTATVIGTEEGGTLQSYEQEIYSTQTIQANLRAGAQFQTRVNLAMEAEFYRSVNSTRWALGKKVANRTVSFKEDFEDVPNLHLDSDSADGPSREIATIPIAMQSFEEAAASCGVQPGDHRQHEKSLLSFQERLCRWLLDWTKHRQKFEAPPRSRCVDPVAELANIMQTTQGKGEIVEACKDFIGHFHITHYVNEIELGAAEYRMFTETEYQHQVGTTHTLNIEQAASSALKQSVSITRSSRAASVKRIGRINDGVVERGTLDEAVVGVGLQPISRLVKQRDLHEAMTVAVCCYMDEDGKEYSEYLRMNDVY